MTDSEKWLPVVGWEGLYEVSDQGRVRSLPRQTRTGRRGGKLLSLRSVSTGAHVVLLCDSGRKRFVHVYRLVAEAFLGPAPGPDTEVRHLDDNRLDSRLVNLAYGSRSDNMVDAVRNGRHNKAKLTIDQVRTIKSMIAAGSTHRSLAERYGVAPVTISAIASGRNWRHVAECEP